MNQCKSPEAKLYPETSKQPAAGIHKKDTENFAMNTQQRLEHYGQQLAGYLTALDPADAAEVIREIQSHVLDVLEQAEQVGQHADLEGILAGFGERAIWLRAMYRMCWPARLHLKAFAPSKRYGAASRAASMAR